MGWDIHGVHGLLESLVKFTGTYHWKMSQRARLCMFGELPRCGPGGVFLCFLHLCELAGNLYDLVEICFTHGHVRLWDKVLAMLATWVRLKIENDDTIGQTKLEIR